MHHNFYNLGSGNWYAWADGITARFAAIQNCTHGADNKRTIQPQPHYIVGLLRPVVHTG